MNHKKFLSVFGIAVIITITIGIFIWSYAKNIVFPVQQPSKSNNLAQENKIYTVKEVVSILKTNPSFLKDKPIQLEAVIVDGVMGFGCDDYWILTDKEYAETFKDRYNHTLDQKDRNKAIEESRRAPVLLTGQTLAISKSLYPTYHAIYKGHFYDEWATKTCGTDGYEKFVIEGKVKEIISTKQLTYRTKTISTGLVIENGRYIQKPYEVTLKDNKVTINGVLYGPSTEEQVNRITELTDDQLLKQWESLISILENNELIIYGGDRYESTKWNYSPTLVLDTDALMKSNKSMQQKREELAKLLDTFPEDSVMDDILKNWK